MMKTFTVYANCQGPALAKTLLETEGFRDIYEYLPLQPVQTLKREDCDKVKKTIAESDLILCQPILSPGKRQKGTGGVLEYAKNFVRQVIPYKGKPAWVGTDELLKCARRDADIFSFPSLYFNAYFPHLDVMNVSCALKRVHDFFIAYSYVKGNSIEKTLEIINSESLYPPDVSRSLAMDTLGELKRRESVNNIDFTVSEFIEKNYKKIKLFNQFNHPRKSVFIYLARKILAELNINFDLNEFSATTGLDATSVPVQRSTYTNLGLSFDEDFQSYRVSPTRLMAQEDIVREYYRTYESVDKKMLMSVIKSRKRFVCDLVDAY